MKLRAASREELVRHPEVLRLYQEVLDRLNGSLAQFERVKRFALLPSEFTMERGELTPTMKVRRQVVEQRWRPLIETIYRSDPYQIAQGFSPALYLLKDPRLRYRPPPHLDLADDVPLRHHAQ